jgi:hypothetical protein
MLYPFFHL